MKTIFTFFLALGLFTLGFAKHGPEQRAEKRVNRMAQNLELSADQQSQIKQLLTDQFTEMKALRATFGEDHEGFKAAAKPVRQKYLAEIDGVLSADQLAKKKELHAQRKAQMQERKNMSPEEKAQKMTDHLDQIVTLTPDQKPAVLSLNVDKVTAMKAARENANGDPKAMKAERKVIKNDYRQKLQKLLTEEQEKKLKVEKRNMRAQKGRKMKPVMEPVPQDSPAPQN